MNVPCPGPRKPPRAPRLPPLPPRDLPPLRSQDARASLLLDKCARDGARAELRLRIRSPLARPVPGRAGRGSSCSRPAALRPCSPSARFPSSTGSTGPLRSRPSPGRRSSASSASCRAPTGARIEGRAPSGGAVFLFAGGRFVATAYVEQGEFHFDDVRADGPYRVGSLALGGAVREPPRRGGRSAAPAAAPGQPRPFAARVAAASLRRRRKPLRLSVDSARPCRRARPLPRPARPARGSRFVRRRLFESRRARDPECPSRAEDPHDDLSDRRIHPPLSRRSPVASPRTDTRWGTIPTRTRT